MRIAITFSHATALGGAERVLEALAITFPNADFFCLFADRAKLPKALEGRSLSTSFLNSLPLIKRHHQLFFPIYPLATEALDLRGYDLVISSDGASTKGVITDQRSVHVCYCHSPHRSIWDQYNHNLRTLKGLKRVLFVAGAHYVRQWDFNAAQRIDAFIANSNFIAHRIRKYYRRESRVIYPPVDTKRGFISKSTEDYYLTVGRLAPIKKTEIIVEACTALGRRLKVAGEGDDLHRLKRIAGPTIEFLGYVDEQELSSLYSRCRAFIFAAEEDFGIAPVEAQMYGRPVIALGRGGILESVVPWNSNVIDPQKLPTGVFFADQTTESMISGIRLFEEVEADFDPECARRMATVFDVSVFTERITDLVSEITGHLDKPSYLVGNVARARRVALG